MGELEYREKREKKASFARWISPLFKFLWSLYLMEQKLSNEVNILKSNKIK